MMTQCLGTNYIFKKKLYEITKLEGEHIILGFYKCENAQGNPSGSESQNTSFILSFVQRDAREANNV